VLGGADLKRAEPHDRVQGATDLRWVARSKPSKPGGTARTERARSWHLRAEGWATIREWTRGQDLDGGATLENPKRGVRASGSGRMVNGFTPGDRMIPELMAA
jgi:hypothetical protein